MRNYLNRGLALVGILMLSMMAFAQQARTVKGKVTDEKGESIPGVNVSVQGTTIGTITDMDGNYVLEVANPDKAVLVFSFIGYQATNVPVGGQSTINSTLKEDAIGLNEVVAIGYGVVKKKDLTGSVSSIKSEEISKTTSSNAMQAMQARVPGMDVQQSSGQAGAPINITVRGNRSILANNNPLIIVDGVEYGSTLDINSNDIESMDVLKDASSTAIYGTKGANGVVIITTKRGKAGKTVVSLNSYLSSNQPTNVPQIMYGQTEVDRRINAERYKRDQALIAAGTGTWGDTKYGDVPVSDVLGGSAVNNLPYSEMDIYNSGGYTNWADLILQNGLTQNYELSVAGGNEKTNFNLSFGTMLEEGLLKNDQMDRYNLKANVDHKINDMFKVGTSLLFTYKSHDKRANVFGQAMKMTSIAQPYNEDGTIIKKPSPTYEAHANPLLDEIDGAYQNNIESTRFFGNSYLEFKPFKQLTFKTMFAIDRSDSRDGLYQDYESVGKLQAASGSYISAENATTTSYIWENTLNYNTDFGGSDHSFSGLLGQEATETEYESRKVSGNTAAEHYYTSSFYDTRNIISPVLLPSYKKSGRLSYFGRVNYSFQDKYLVTASLRADGSTMLSPGNKWGSFPSVSGAWRMSEESFLAGTEWLTNLKMRLSYGISGNSAINPYDTYTVVSDFPVYYNIDGKEYTGKVPAQMGNTELTWETTAATNIGIDFGFLNNRITGSVDAFMSNTSDLLFYQYLPSSNVYPQVIDNIGKTEGKGIEIALNTLVVNAKDFKWDINWSASKYKDKVTELSEGLTRSISGNEAYILGEPVKVYYDYEADGCWGVGEYDAYKAEWLTRHSGETMAMTGDPGTIKIIDANDDGKLDDSDKRTYDRNPKMIFGMNNSLSYKDFGLSVLVYARIGGYIAYDYNTLVTYDGSNWADVDYWTYENQSAKFPTPYNNTNWASYGRALTYEDASYIKIKDITLSYNLPNSVLSSIGVSKVRIYSSLKNYFTFSKIDNYDSERGGSVAFPLAKQFVCGLNVEF